MLSTGIVVHLIIVSTYSFFNLRADVLGIVLAISDLLKVQVPGYTKESFKRTLHISNIEQAILIIAYSCLLNKHVIQSNTSIL